MSYILEAIRRSEEARNKRVIPAVSTVHSSPPPASRPASRTLQAGLIMGLAAALVVAAGLALGPALRRVDAPAPATDAREWAAAEPRAPAAGSLPQAPPAAEALVQGAPETPAEPAPAAASQEHASLAADGAEAEAKPKRRPYSSPASGEGKAKRMPKAVPAASAAGSAATPGGAPPEAPPVAPAELVAATALRDLPPALQRTLPSIGITLHRYASAPEARMIRVNGRMAREGDIITGDLGVAEITRNGVVFVTGEQRFYMDAFQSWQAKGGS